MVRGRMTAVPLHAIVGQPTLQAVQKLVEQLSAYSSHFHTNVWDGRHGHLSLVLDQAKMRVVTNTAALDCSRLTKPELVHPGITRDTKGRDLLEYQEKQKQKWSEYYFMLVVDAVAVEAIAAAVDEQYIDELREEYVGYKNATIKTMIKQLRTMIVIV